MANAYVSILAGIRKESSKPKLGAKDTDSNTKGSIGKNSII
jgi:hypothetical protein